MVFHSQKFKLIIHKLFGWNRFVLRAKKYLLHICTFTDNPLQNLNTYAGKRVCFKEVMFPLLPRMLWGLYYNTPLSHNECQNSALFKSFSDFITNRLQIKTPDIKKKLQVTVLVRKTKHRQILNLPSLHDALIDDGNYEVVIAPFTHNYPTFRKEKIEPEILSSSLVKIF